MVCKESSTMAQFTPPEIWKQHTVLHGIDTEGSECMSVNLRANHIHIDETKHPMFEIISSDGDVMPPFIFQHSHTLNAEAYIKYLGEVVQFWIKRVVAGRPYIWKQDLVPWYTSRRTQCWLSENFCNHISPNILTA